MKDLPLLIEIFTEELPALPLLKAYPQMAKKWQDIAKSHHIISNPSVYYTPRRIVLYEEHFPLKSEDSLIASYGPPLEIALNADKSLTKAGLSFFKKLNLPLDTPFEIVKKGQKEVLYYAKTQAGQDSIALIPLILEEWLKGLSFGKNMFWGNVEEGFIRPVRNILILFGEHPINAKYFGITSKAHTFGHRHIGFAPLKISSSAMYFAILKEHKVILDQETRKNIILEQIADIQMQHNIRVEIDEALLDEIVAITEYPRAVYGRFEETFLRLPKEVIITSMKEHQRYFATYIDSKLNNGFVLVTNAIADDLYPIIEGNQKVLKARLKDAMFFYENDLKNGFEPHKLEQILFVESLGSLLDKSKREYAIALELLKSYTSILSLASPAVNLKESQELLTTSIKYAKADLLTQMVYEFPELQGIMGYYYAQNFNFHPLVALCLKEQYLPVGEDSALPSHILSAIVALSIKFDNIFSLFSIDKFPTGSKDPFALRRAAIGILKIIRHFSLDFSLSSDLARLYQAGGYKPSDIARIEIFFYERLEGMLGINPSILRCVRLAKTESASLDIISIIENAYALSEFFEKSDKNALIALFKRVANILSTQDNVVCINQSLLLLPAEKDLFQALQDFKSAKFSNIRAHIAALFNFKEPLEAFFESVLVNDNDPAIKANRECLIREIYDEFLKIGDMKEISI